MQALKRKVEDPGSLLHAFLLQQQQPVLVEGEPPAHDADDGPGAASSNANPEAGRAALARRESTGAAPARQTPELSAVLRVVTQAAEQVKAARERADLAERQAADLTSRIIVQLKRAEAQIDAAQDQIRSLENQVAAGRALSEQLRTAEAEGILAHDRIRELEAEIGTLSDRLTAAEIATKDADDRTLAAQTRAMEAFQDMRYLEKEICARFDIQPA